TALHHACIQEREDMVELLFSFHAQANLRDNSGRTPLHLALARHQTEVLRTLLHHGADGHAVDPEGRAPLHYAAIAGWVGPVRVLLQHGVDVNANSEDGNTALHVACIGGFKQVMWLLLHHGANVYAKDSNGLTVLQLASASEQSASIVRLLRHFDEKAEADSATRARSRASNHEILRTRKEEPRRRPSRDGLGLIEDDVADAEIDSARNRLGRNDWDGVRRENGDGFTLAKYDGHDIYCDAKMESIHSSTHEGQEMHAVQLKLNFMKPHALKHRIRYAEVDVALQAASSGASPNIRTIMPQADRVEVSEQEITTGQKFTVGANGNGGPSSLNISMEGSKGKKSTFKRVRIIHGAVKDRMHASWRLYEEPGSKSGLPEIVRLLLVVQCEAEFELRVAMSAKASHSFSFGIPRTVSARKGPSYLVPNLADIMSLEQAMKLKLILGVADRAAVAVEDARKLEQQVTRSIKEHRKRALIMEAGASESNIRDWAAIADASSYGDFALLCEKLLRTSKSEYPEVRSGRRRWSPPRAPIIERSYLRRSPSPYAEDRAYTRRMRARLGVDDAEEAIAPTHRSRNVHGFSAVGPGYKVSRLA
ncbi:ankyrin repeat domain-containing protein, partial [Aspergillus saccharolyticus JOP 1030-1]